MNKVIDGIVAIIIFVGVIYLVWSIINYKYQIVEVTTKSNLTIVGELKHFDYDELSIYGHKIGESINYEYTIPRYGYSSLKYIRNNR
jgi:hypothetical protein